MERMYPSVDPVNVQRRVTKYQSQDLKSPDDPAQDGMIDLVSSEVLIREVCPPSWHRLHSLVINRVSREGVSL